MKSKILIISWLFFFKIVCFAQSNISKQVEDYLKVSLEKRSTTDELKKILASDNLKIVYALDRFTSDTIIGMRVEAYNLLSKVGNNCMQDETRKRIVKLLVKGCRDKDSGICGMVLNSLCQFSNKDFDTEAAYELSMLTKEKIPFYHKLIKLVGFVNIPDVKPEFKKMLDEKKYPNNQVRWALHLALARMGEVDEVDFCVKKVRSLPLNDDVVYDIVPDLVYTRQKKAFDYLFEIIESDKKDCSSANPDSNAKIICAYRVIGQIAPCIENFPIDTDISGDLKTKDYGAALVKVRDWIKSNKDTYVIKSYAF